MKHLLESLKTPLGNFILIWCGIIFVIFLFCEAIDYKIPPPVPPPGGHPFDGPTK